MSSTSLTFLHILGKTMILRGRGCSLLWDREEKNIFVFQPHLQSSKVLRLIQIWRFFYFFPQKWGAFCFDVDTTKYLYSKGHNCALTACRWMRTECKFMHVSVHMQACVCLFVCARRSVKGSRMAYKAHCVSNGDMWLGERAPSKSLF